MRRAARFNLVAVNGTPVQAEHERLRLGDIVQLCPNLSLLLNHTAGRKKTLFKRLGRYKRIQKVVIQSQWRDRKKLTPDFYSTSYQVDYFAVPA
jgi:hypothetical protein